MSSEETGAARSGVARTDGRKPARPYWMGLALVAFGALWLQGGLALPLGSRYAGIGPGLVPSIIGGVLVLLGVILTLQIRGGETFEAQDSEDASSEAPMDRMAFATALAAVVLPVFAMGTLGLPLTAALSFTLVARALGSRRPVFDLLVGAVVGTVAWFLFTRLGLQLGTFLPIAGL